jgi:hypothetical protein
VIHQQRGHRHHTALFLSSERDEEARIVLHSSNQERLDRRGALAAVSELQQLFHEWHVLSDRLRQVEGATRRRRRGGGRELGIESGVQRMEVMEQLAKRRARSGAKGKSTLSLWKVSHILVSSHTQMLSRLRLEELHRPLIELEHLHRMHQQRPRRPHPKTSSTLLVSDTTLAHRVAEEESVSHTASEGRHSMDHRARVDGRRSRGSLRNKKPASSREHKAPSFVLTVTVQRHLHGALREVGVEVKELSTERTRRRKGRKDESRERESVCV